MDQIDLKQLIEQYPEVLTDGTKLKAYILDLYPQCKRGMVNILVAIQQCGIVAEMQTSKNPSALDMSRWKKVLDDDYGFTGEVAETCLQMWCSAVGVHLETRAKATQKTSVPSDLQNSQRDWFEYDESILLRLKGKYREYGGVIYIPNGVESINDFAFLDCANLTSVIISNGVTSIDDFAFAGCASLTSITIPDSVTNIGEVAFKGCEKLKSITIPDSMDEVGEKAFCECSGLTSVTIPDGVTSIGNSAFQDCVGLTSVTIGNGVTSIGYCAFQGCTGLASVTIGSGVTSIDDSAFGGCTALTSVTIPGSVTSINANVFNWCTGLTSIVVCNGNPVYHSQSNCLVDTKNKMLVTGCPASVIPIDGTVKLIGTAAFEGCTTLTSIMIPDGITNIGAAAFMSCTGLISITISKSITSIGDCAFSNCKQLKEIRYTGKIDDWNAIAKGYHWNEGTKFYTIHCTDGDIPKNES